MTLLYNYSFESLDPNSEIIKDLKLIIDITFGDFLFIFSVLNT